MKGMELLYRLLKGNGKKFPFKIQVVNINSTQMNFMLNTKKFKNKNLKMKLKLKINLKMVKSKEFM